MQLGLQQERQRDRQHSRLFRQRDRGLEVPINEEGHHSDWTHYESPLPGHEP